MDAFLFALKGLISVITFGLVTFGSIVARPLPVPSATPTPTPTVSRTPVVRTPTPSGTPILNVRLSHVRTQLLALGYSETDITKLLTDRRRALLPVRSVAYRPPNWDPIKAKLYSDTYVYEGKNFIATNRAAFDQAERDFGVPAGIITGIIAIETEFGRNTGSTPTFNAIYSRMTHKKATENWQLEANRLIALSRYCLDRRVDCFTIKGSYAGAMGIVQFMPDSMMRFGIDGNKDGFIDLNKPVDAIPSAANFLKQHGWDQDHQLALTRYYGNPVGYPEIVLQYAELVK